MEFAMTDLDPEIWNNKTLGEAANGQFADEMQMQAIEDRAAKLENREPMLVRRIHRYPGARENGDQQLASSYDDGLRYVNPETLEPGPGEYSEVKPDGEASNANHPEDEEFDGTEDGGSGNVVATESATGFGGSGDAYEGSE
jgi:hypothetical protein